MRQFTVFFGLYLLSLSVFCADMQDEYVTLTTAVSKYDIPLSRFNESLREIKKTSNDLTVQFGNTLAVEHQGTIHEKFKIVELWYRIIKGQDLSEKKLKIKLVLPKGKVNSDLFGSKQEAFSYIKTHKPSGFVGNTVYELRGSDYRFLVPKKSLMATVIQGSTKDDKHLFREMHALGIISDDNSAEIQPALVFFRKTKFELGEEIEEKITIHSLSISKASDLLGQRNFETKELGLAAINEYFDNIIYGNKPAIIVSQAPNNDS